MCLESVSATINPTTLIQSGWKEFNGTQARPCFETYAFNGSRDVPLNKWITAEGNHPITVSQWHKGKSYDPGFHIYEDENELTTLHRKRRVYYRNVHTRGQDRSKTVVIAREMYVPSDPDAWPPR